LAKNFFMSLLNRGGIDDFAVGVGEEWPVDPANPKVADNRRVQRVNLGLVK
jgi:hypothetical protein